MAADYWESTQARYWTFTKSELHEQRTNLARSHQALHNRYPLPETRLLNIYFQQNLIKLARRMGLRQQALATAQVYLKRFYLRVELRKTNPYLLLATSVYLACKTEECPQHIRLMLAEAARQWPELGVSETSKIGECEFALISTLSSRLILHHPYRALAELAPQFGLSADDQALAHNIVNDAYNTDLLLLYPPHIVAVVAIVLAVVLRPAAAAATAAAAAGGGPGAQHAGNNNNAFGNYGNGSPMMGHGGAGGLGAGAMSPTMASSPTHQFSPGGAYAASSHPPTPGHPTLTAAAAQGALLGFKQAGPKLAKIVDWLAESLVDMHAIVDATQEMISLYEVWENYSERGCKEAINRFMNASK